MPLVFTAGAPYQRNLKWVVALAQRVLKRGWRPLLEERSRRCYSTFQLGLRWLTRLLTNEQHVPCLLRLWAEKAAPLKLS